MFIFECLLFIHRRHSSPPDLKNVHGVATDNSERGEDYWRNMGKGEYMILPSVDTNDDFVVVDGARGRTLDDVFDEMQTQSQEGKSEENTANLSGNELLTTCCFFVLPREMLQLKG